jgi:ribosomal protein S18 acetylase RimI-like enzyme
MADTLICHYRDCEKPKELSAEGAELEDSSKNETRDDGMYEIKYIKDPECYISLKKADELMRSAFDCNAPTTLPETMPGIVVCIKRDTDELIGLLYIEDEFNNNKSLSWHGGESTIPQSQCEYNYFQIRGMCIKNEYRSKGFGSHLLNFAKKLGSDNGFHYMFATVDLDKDKDRRIKFYKKNNFYKQILSLTNSNESPPLDRSEKNSVRYVSYISDKDDEDIFRSRYERALSQEGTDDYTNAPPRVVKLSCPYTDTTTTLYCGKSKILSAEDTKLIESFKELKNIGKHTIPFIDDFIKQCNKPDDREITDLNILVRKLAGAYTELKKLKKLNELNELKGLATVSEQQQASFRPQLDLIGENMCDMIIALVPIPSSCRHEFPRCEWCNSSLYPWCSDCPNNIGVDQRIKRWSQLVRKCDAGPIIRRMKSHQNGANRVAARANDLDYPEEDTAAGLFDEEL